MRILVGDDVGQLKVIETKNGIDTTQKTSARATTTSFFPPSRTRPIQHATVVKFKGQEDLAAIFSRGGLLRILDPLSDPLSPTILFTHTLPVPPETDAISLGLYSPTHLFAAASTGHTLFLDLSTGSYEVRAFPGPISLLSVYSPSSSPVSLLPPTVATAAENRDVELFNTAEPPTSTWKAKNVKPNAIKLAAPIHPTKCVFLPSKAGSHRFMVATKQGVLRVYDTAVSRRPVWSQQVCKDKIIALELHPESDLPDEEEEDDALWNEEDVKKGVPAEQMRLARQLRVVLADYAGGLEVYSLDERRSVGLYKGLTGAVMGVEVKEGVVAAVGLGRYMAVWDAGTRKMLTRVFVKTQGAAVAVLRSEDEVEEKVEKKEEDLWEGMEEVGQEVAEEGDVSEKLVRIKVKRRKGIAEGGVGKRQKV